MMALLQDFLFKDQSVVFSSSTCYTGILGGCALF